MAEVKNIGSTIQNDITVKSTVYNETGGIIETQERFIYSWDHLLPNQKAPIVILGGWLSESETSDIVNYDIEILNSTVIDDWQYQDLEIENVISYVDEEGIFTVEGDLMNTGSSSAISYRVIATFYDDSGFVLDSSIDPVLPPVLSTLNPGEVYHFKKKSYRSLTGIFDVNDDIKDYSLLVQCAEPIIPEFSILIIPLVIIVTLVTIAIRKHFEAKF